jgi:hypothetical protein
LSSRAALTVLLAATLGFLGLAAGMTAGAVWLVPENSGLVGPAVALAYGLLGGVAATIAGILLGIRMPIPGLRVLTGVCAIAAVSIFVLLTWRFASDRADRVAQRERAHEAISPFQQPYEMTLRVFADDRGGLDFPFSELRIVQAENRREATWETLGMAPERCRAPVPPLASIDVAAALQQVDGTLRSAFLPCTANQEEPPLARVEWSIPGLAPEHPEGALRITAGCLDADPGTQRLLQAVATLFRQAEGGAVCSPIDRGIAARVR